MHGIAVGIAVAVEGGMGVLLEGMLIRLWKLRELLDELSGAKLIQIQPRLWGG